MFSGRFLGQTIFSKHLDNGAKPKKMSGGQKRSPWNAHRTVLGFSPNLSFLTPPSSRHHGHILQFGNTPFQVIVTYGRWLRSRSCQGPLHCPPLAHLTRYGPSETALSMLSPRFAFASRREGSAQSWWCVLAAGVRIGLSEPLNCLPLGPHWALHLCYDLSFSEPRMTAGLGKHGRESGLIVCADIQNRGRGNGSAASNRIFPAPFLLAINRWEKCIRFCGVQLCQQGTWL